MLKQALIVSIAAVALGAAASAEQPVVSLSLLPERQLPGLPFELRLEVSNTSHQTLEVLAIATLYVRSAAHSEEPVFCGAPDGRVKVVAADAPPVLDALPGPTKVPPGGSVLMLVPLEAPLKGAFSSDPRFAIPGRYFIRAEIGYTQGDPTMTASSNVVEIEVLEPEGVDKLVWNRIKRSYIELLGETPEYILWDDWVTPQTMFIFENAAESGYVPYVAGSNLPPYDLERTARRLEMAIEKWPGLPITNRNWVVLTRCADAFIRQDAPEETIRRNYARLERAVVALEKAGAWKGHVEEATERMRTLREGWQNRAPRTMPLP